MSEPSKLFREIFMSCGGGTPVATCSCGTIHYSDSLAYDEGEKEALEKRAALEPTRYYHQPYDGVGVYEIMGRVFVDGCPCDYTFKLEKLLLSDRTSIAKYLRELAKLELQDAEQRVKEAP